tara:strand:+ start:44 stop:805 length:762 start_codon:yes stop_codon:yes gene_type:complete
MIDKIDNIKRKKSDEAIFLGSGPSINDLDEKYLEGKDIWTANGWYFHPTIIPDFWHMEMKEHRCGPTTRKLLSDRRKEYKDVSWVLNSTRPHLLAAVKPEWYENIFLYDPNDEKIKAPFGASFTIIIQLMFHMGYKKIYFCGVDLYDCRYFWTDNPKYEGIVPPILNSCKPDERSKDEIHSTQEKKIAQWISKYLKHPKRDIEAINLSKKSMLKEFMKTILSNGKVILPTDKTEKDEAADEKKWKELKKWDQK